MSIGGSNDGDGLGPGEMKYMAELRRLEENIYRVVSGQPSVWFKLYHLSVEVRKDGGMKFDYEHLTLALEALIKQGRITLGELNGDLAVGLRG